MQWPERLALGSPCVGGTSTLQHGFPIERYENIEGIKFPCSP